MSKLQKQVWDIPKIIKWGFRLLCLVGIVVVMCGNIVNAQDNPKPKSPIESLTDDNFKKKIAKGFVLIKFTAPYQMAMLDVKLLDGIKGIEGCVV